MAASFTEDKYGVVQKNLPDILSMLLDFQTVIFLIVFLTEILDLSIYFLYNL